MQPPHCRSRAQHACLSHLEQFSVPHLKPGMHLAAGLGPKQACHLAGIPAKHLGRSIKDADLQRGQKFATGEYSHWSLTVSGWGSSAARFHVPLRGCEVVKGENGW